MSPAVWTTSYTQLLLASAGYYKGAIDNATGPMTRAAIEIVCKNDDHDMATWSAARREVGAGQLILNAQGFEAGPVDGYAGHNTFEALATFLSKASGNSSDVVRAPSPSHPDPDGIPRQADVAAFYGQPGTEENMAFAEFPFYLRLDWNLSQNVDRLRVHKLCAAPLVDAITLVRSHYGQFRWRDLGLDRFAGGYNPRKMRGSNAWSMHAYGCAVDFYAAPNGLRTRCPDALFCDPEYKDFLDIMEAHNWLPAIRLWGGDAMHFQMARL